MNKKRTSSAAAQLSRRERQIMEIVYSAKEVAAAEVLQKLPEPPSYSTVRKLMSILVDKGHLKHRLENGKYIYRSTRARDRVGRSALARVLETFYEGSLEKAVAALLQSRDSEVSPEELERLSQLIDQARKEGAEMTWLKTPASLLESTGAILLDSALKGLLVIMVAALLVLALRKGAAAWRHLVWSLAATSLLVLPCLSITLPPWQISVPVSWLPTAALPDGTGQVGTTPEPTLGDTPPPSDARPAADTATGLHPLTTSMSTLAHDEHQDASGPGLNNGAHPTSAPAHADTTEAPRRRLTTILRLLTLVWLLGAAAALSVPCLGSYQLFQLKRRATVLQSNTVRSDATLQLLATIRHQLKIRREVLLMMDGQMHMPLTWGWLRPVLLIPENILNGDERTLHTVLLHELAHIKRCDWLTQVVSHFACALHWFNPLIWYAAQRMQSEREQACDDIVLSSGSPASEYAAELLHFAQKLQLRHALVAAAIPIARNSSLERRVISILDRTRRRAAIGRGAIAAGIALSLAIVGPIAMVRALPTSDQDKSDADTPPGDVSVALGAGQWPLPDDVTLHITSDSTNVKNPNWTAMLRWPAAKDRPALRHEFHLASSSERWALAWRKGEQRLWLVNALENGQRPNLQAIDFGDPERIVTRSQYSDEEFRSSEPESEVVNARRDAASIATPLPAIPEAVKKLLASRIPALKDLGRGLYQYGGEYREPAVTEKKWTVSGTVHDTDGRPLGAVTVTARTEYHPTVIIARSHTDETGRFQLSFRIDLKTLGHFRGVMVTPHRDGAVERNLAHDGEFTLLLTENEPVNARFSERLAVLGETVKTEFILDPAVNVTGTIVDQAGKPREKAYIALKAPGQRKGYSVAAATSDAQGKFVLKNVPIGRPLDIVANVFQRPLETGKVENYAATTDPASPLLLKLIDTSGTWTLSLDNDPPPTPGGDEDSGTPANTRQPPFPRKTQHWGEVREPLDALRQRVHKEGTLTSLAQPQASDQQPKVITPRERTVSVNATNEPLQDVLRKLCEASDVQLDLDRDALKEVDLSVDIPVTVRIDKQPLEQAARRVVGALRHPGIYVELTGNNTVLVTSFAAWQQRIAEQLPAWLRPLHNNGMVARLEGEHVTELYLGEVADEALLAKLKTLPHLRKLDIQASKKITAAGLAHLGDIKSLESLQLYSIPLVPESLTFLGRLQSLQELSIAEAQLTDEALRQIGQLRQLRVLNLSGNLLTDAGTQHLKNLINLEALSIPHTNWVESRMSITDAGLANLAGLVKLRELDLSGLPVTDEGIQQLAKLTELRHLQISRTAIDGSGLGVLANYSHLDSLILGGGALGDEAMPHVAKCPTLRTLHLGYTSVSDEGFQHVARLGNLEKLSLDSYGVTDAGIRHLTSLKQLKHIELRASHVTDTSLAHLSKIKSLTRLDLSGSGYPGVSIGRNFTGTGYGHLARLPNLRILYLNNADVRWTELAPLKQLEELSMMMPTMSHDDVRALQKALPTTRVTAMWGGSSIGPEES